MWFLPVRRNNAKCTYSSCQNLNIIINVFTVQNSAVKNIRFNSYLIANSLPLFTFRNEINEKYIILYCHSSFY